MGRDDGMSIPKNQLRLLMLYTGFIKPSLEMEVNRSTGYLFYSNTPMLASGIKGSASNLGKLQICLFHSLCGGALFPRLPAAGVHRSI